MPRTDIHAPKNLITEDYELVGCGEFGTAGEPGYSPIAPGNPGAYLIDEGWHFGENHSAGSCYHCGASLRYYAILKHVPTRTLVRVGETCLGNRFERSTKEFQALRKAAQLDREQQRIKNTRLGWMAVNPDAEVAFAWASERVENGDFGWEGTRHSFVSRINREGSVSDKMLKLIMRDMARTERFEAERAIKDAAEAEIASPVIEGRIVITGEVLVTKWQDSDYGGSLKMLVRDDRGFKVWGSVPSSLTGIPVMGPLDREALEFQVKINMERHAGVISGTYYKDIADAAQAKLDADDGSLIEVGERNVEKGDRVTFTATVEAAPAKDVYNRETGEMEPGEADESFGFFKRPSKASILDAE